MSGQAKAVFLSYASEDSGHATRMAAALAAAGMVAWLDKSQLRGGDAWDSLIRQQIRRDLERVLEIAPGQADALFRLAWLDLWDGSPDEALARTAGVTQRWWRVSVEAGAKCARRGRPAGIAQLDAWVREEGADAPLAA